MDALPLFRQALELDRDADDRGHEAASLDNIGHAHDRSGDHGHALHYVQQALPISRDIGDRGGEAATLNNIGQAHDGLGDAAS